MIFVIAPARKENVIIPTNYIIIAESFSPGVPIVKSPYPTVVKVYMA